MEIVLIVFLIFAISMLGISWFQANVIGGEAVEDEIMRQSEFDDADTRLQNTLTYLQEAFFTSGERGTDEAGSMAGRYQNDPEYRYWLCENEPQPATLEEARNASGTFVMADFADRINEVHGIRNNYIHEIGSLQCSEVGYYEPRKTPDNDHFKSAYQIEDAGVYREDEDITRDVENITQKRDILYNRYWYMYEILKVWVQNEDMKDEVRQAIREQVPDTKEAPQNRMCVENPEQECETPGAYSCRFKHEAWLNGAVYDGLEAEMRKLETAPEYFNNTGVSCHVEFNELRDQPDRDGPNISFPGHRVEPRGNTGGDTGICCDDKKHHGDDEPDSPDDDDDDDGCDATYYDCGGQWYLAFESYLDFTVVCEDEKFNTVPMEDDLEHLSWEIDLSYTVQEEEQGEEYDVPGTWTECIERAHPPVSYLPLTLNPCTFEEEELDTCEVPVETIGELR